jgi:hypothetical protein
MGTLASLEIIGRFELVGPRRFSNFSAAGSLKSCGRVKSCIFRHMTSNAKNTLQERLEDVFEAQNWSEYLALLAEVSREFPNKIVLLDSPYPVQRYGKGCSRIAAAFTRRHDHGCLHAGNS